MSQLGGRVRLGHRTATLSYHLILRAAVMLHASCRGKLSRPEYTASRSIHFDALAGCWPLDPGPASVSEAVVPLLASFERR